MKALLLGQFELLLDGKSVRIRTPQQTCVLVVLLLRANESVSVDRLYDIVWGDRSTKDRKNAVSHEITAIRRALGAAKDAIEKTADGYLLRIDPDDVDKLRFERLCDEAAAARDADVKLAALREAVGLWRGPYLGGVDIDKVGGETVISPEPRYLDALGDLAELELARERPRPVRDMLQPVVAEDPAGRTRLVGLLMRAFTANGDPVRALALYHRTREVLDEQGMDTPVELRNFAAVAQLDRPSSRLPRLSRRPVGRARELDEIRDAVAYAARQELPAWVWISGPPGIGKSTLALAAGRDLSGEFPDHQVMVNLNGSSPNVTEMSTAAALAELLTQLGMAPEQLAETVGERMRDYQSILAGAKALVVLDNALSERQVRDLLPEAAGCAVLVTSRHAGGIESGTPVRLDPLSADAARRLFEESVGATRVAADRRRLDEVVAWCGGIPLAICVVAAVFRKHPRWTLEYLLQLLHHDGSWSPDSPFGEVGKAVAVSYQQLSDQQRRMFRLLAALPGPDVNVTGAAAAGGTSVSTARNLLTELQGMSLVDETEPDRYRMLDPLKECAAAIEPASPQEADESRDGLLDFQLVTTAAAMRVAYPFDTGRQPDVARTSAVALTFPDEATAQTWLAAERWNLAAAIRSAAERGRTEHAWQLAVLVWRWHYARGQVVDWAQALQLARTILDVPGGDRSGLAYVLLRLSGARWVTGDYAEARELAQQALDIWTELGDEAAEAAAHMALGLSDIRTGRHETATAHVETALREYDLLHDDRGRAYALSNLGYLYETRDDIADAERCYTEAVRVLRELGHRHGLAHVLSSLADVQERLAELDAAEATHEEARQLAVESREVSAQAYAVNGLGNVRRRRGDAVGALRLQEQAKKLADQVNDPGLRSQLYLDRGETFAALDDFESAATAYLSALDLSKERPLRARAALGAARARHRLGKCRLAAELWLKAVDEYAELALGDAEGIRAEYEALTCDCRS